MTLDADLKRIQHHTVSVRLYEKKLCIEEFCSQNYWILYLRDFFEMTVYEC